MNFLPFVVTLLVILALFSSSHFNHYSFLSKKEKTYVSYFRTLRQARNQKETAAYKYQIAKQHPKTEKPKEEKKVKEVPYFREEKVGWDSGRLNLYALIDDPLKWPKLKEVAINYVNRLYSHSDFYPKDPHFTEKLIERFIQAVRKEGIETPFQSLHLGEPYKSVFFYMLLGTQTYVLEQEGYPPFGHFFVMERQERPPMMFQEANLTFLSIALGQKGMKTISALERKEVKEKGTYHSSLDRKKVEEELIFNPPDPALLDLFDFASYPSKRRKGKAHDKETNMTVRID